MRTRVIQQYTLVLTLLLILSTPGCAQITAGGKSGIS
jgi:hypothetical protein